MVEHGATRKKVRVCTINVDTDEWRADRLGRRFIRNELGIDGSTPLILFGGRLCAQKQPRVLARTFDLLRERGTNFVALIAGDGPEMPRLRRFVKRRRLEEQVRLLGEVTPNRVRELMQTADVFFMPSRWEGIALSFYEAMSCGVPVVGAAVGGQVELVTPACGVLLPSADPRSEANAYADVLAELCGDRARRAAMGRSARARVRQHFHVDRMGDRMVELIDEAIAQSGKLPRRSPTLAVARQQVQRVLAEMRARDGVTSRIRAMDPLEGIATRAHWRARVYRTLFRLHEPVFHWYVARGWTWMHPVRRAVRKVLLRFATAD